MSEYRKKPIIVKAEQYLPEQGLIPHGLNMTAIDPNEPSLGNHMIIQTLEGSLHVSPGDWVITGVKGEKYPCKPDIFEQTYEPVAKDGETK